MEQSYFPTNGPVWMKNRSKSEFIGLRKANLNYRKFPVCDGMSVGPIIEMSEFKDSSDSIDASSLRSSCKLKQLKQINCEFPIKRSIPCFLPFENINQESEPLNYFCKKGSCSNIVDTFSSGDANYLIYPTYTNSVGQINLSEITKDKNNSVKFLLKNQKIVTECNDVCQLEAKLVNNEECILVRSSKNVSLHLNDFNSHYLLPVEGAKCSTLHSLLKGTLATVNNDSSVNVYNIERSFPLWNGTFAAGDNSTVFECQFADHPLNLYIASDQETWLVDTRVSSKNLSRKLFSIKNMNNYINNNEDVVVSIKGVPDLPYFYATCSMSVILMDNRYCKSPVLTWQHMIRNVPEFPQFYNKDINMKGMILADRLRNCVCIIPTIYSNADLGHPKISTISTPKHFNILKDTLHFAHMNGIWHSKRVLQSMVNQPIIGMAVSSLPSQNQSLICFQNCTGQLFYQIIEVADSPSDVISLPDPEETITTLQKSAKSVMKNYERKVSKNRQQLNFQAIETVHAMDMRNKKSRRTMRNISYLGKYEGPIIDLNKANSLCKGTHKRWNELLNFEKDDKFMERLKSETKNLTDCLHTQYSDININELKTYTDPLSQKLLLPWVEFFNEPKPTCYEMSYGFSYKRLPISLDNVTLPYVDLSTRSLENCSSNILEHNKSGNEGFPSIPDEENGSFIATNLSFKNAINESNSGKTNDKKIANLNKSDFKKRRSNVSGF